ncbi:hypothetical protein ABFX02_06G198800 [Erythranthe guttata]
MADAAIFYAVQALGVLVVEKAGFLQGVEAQVKWLKDGLERMQCFLKDAAEKQAQNESIRQWISDIREVAQDADDVIETFILKFDTPRSSEGSLGRLIYFLKHLYRLNVVGKEIDSIKAKLQDIERSRVRYGIQNLGEMTESSRRPEVGEVEWQRRLSPWQKDEHLVGLERDMKLLLENAILDGREGLAVATVVGMGGIGKSTLAKKVYNHSGVAKQFDIRAWVVVSSDFRPRDIIKELMLQFLEPEENKLKLVETMEKLPLPSVQQMLHERLLGKRYFIVLDDLWENKHWESLASVFPVEGQGSRLLLTSRDRNITKHARYIHEMKMLDSEESWKLLMKKAFIDNNDGKCPEDLYDIGREILRKCDGLPLAISVVGGLLVDRSPSKSQWENVSKEINSHLGTRESSVSEILELSYRNLSPKLKSCFLCLGFFKEDATIRTKRLIQVWIANGLIQQGSRGENTMEEIGQNYLDELINRNMVQVKDMSYDESVKNCHIHDLLRELSIRKAKEEISFEIRKEDGNSQSLNKPRHRALYCSTEKFIYSAGKNKYLRSLLVHGSVKLIDLKPSYWKSFELLKILDFEDFKLKKLPDTIGDLAGLRYLGLRNTKIWELPRSLGRLKKLEVLDVAKNDTYVRDVIWKMDTLRHIYMHHNKYISEPLRIDTLKNLHTLSYISTDNFDLEHLTQLASLRILGIVLNTYNFGFSTLCSSLKNLVCLKVRNVHKIPTSMDVLGTMCNLTKLKLEGKLTKLPDLPPNLSYLTLVEVELLHDPTPVLEKLPKLLGLKLDSAYYKVKKMEVSEKGYPKLKVLILRHMWDLKTIQVGKGGGMPELKRLEIYKCSSLAKKLPEKLRLITTLLEGVEECGW